MSEAVNIIEQRIVDLQKFCQEKTNFLTQIDHNIKQLKHERKLTEKSISEVQGAIQGFVESVKLIKAQAPVVSTATCDVHLVDETVAEVTAIEAPAETEVVEEAVVAE
jgi:prefoldin subunit 5